MNFSKFLFVIIIINLLGCKSKTNQIKDHQREGKWVSIDTLDYIYITKGKYHKGIEVGTWRHYYNQKMIKKEKYHKGSSYIKYYYPNGKIIKRGHTKSDSNEIEDHWYYYGKWYFYNEKGKLDSIKTYKKESVTDSVKAPQ
ncbi:hypothetical protein [Flavobacterium sp. ov086]|uniref:hypothetical protein n=1 Tax=Flavobacterium sp. ov086 TaxID=1761785 RepID=UPI000B6C24A4|nr:hypothetical protein [Flavobacterium sp. ov086]SNR95125.1 hypothetical protein SAMN04487979_1341 [Flavobacterium sp. ov086]